jgi:hypothetical protein
MRPVNPPASPFFLEIPFILSRKVSVFEQPGCGIERQKFTDNVSYGSLLRRKMAQVLLNIFP